MGGERREDARLAVAEEALKRQQAMRDGQPAFAPAMVPEPKQPTAEERQRHELTHYPSMPWCLHCIAGKGKERAHHRMREPEQALDQHLIVADFCLINTAAGGIADAAEEFSSTLVVVERDSGSIAAAALPSKEATAYAAEFIPSFIDRCGITNATLRTDGEVTMTKLADLVKAKRSHATQLQQAPKHSSASIGAVERAHWEV